MSIEEIVKDQINSAIGDFDFHDAIDRVLRESVRSEILMMLREITKEQVSLIVADEIQSVLKGGEIKTDDGFGRKESYACFEDLFKKAFYEKLNSSWDMKREIEKQVTHRVNSLFKDHQQNINKYIVKRITESEA